MYRTSWMLGCLGVPLVFTGIAPAQTPRPVFFDATFGRGGGIGGGEFAYRAGGAVEAQLGLRPGRSGFIVTAAVGDLPWHLPWHHNVGIFTPGGTELFDFHELRYVSLVGGWEGSTGAVFSERATVGVAVGPALVHVDPDDSRRRDGDAGGVQAQLDLAALESGHTALVVSLRGMVVPRFQGQRFGVWALSGGLRIR